MKELFVKDSRGSKYVCASLGLLCLISFFFSLLSWTTPETIEKKVTENIIKQKTGFEIKAEVIPSTLYPSGGLVIPENTIYSTITKGIRVNITSGIMADKPTDVEGKQNIRMKLISKDNWERGFYSAEESDLLMQANTEKIIEKAFVINPSVIQAFIDNVEKETKVSGQYFLKISTQITGNILNGNKKIPLKDGPEIMLSYNNRQIQLVGQNKEPIRFDEPLTVEQVTPIEKTEIIVQNFNLLGLTAPLKTVRYVTLSLTVIFLSALVYIYRLRRSQRPKLSAAAKIDKKYNKRLVTVSEKIKSNQYVEMKSFKSLLNFAEEKEQPILRYERQDSAIEYFIISEGYSYGYKADNKIEEDPEQKIEIISTSGSDYNA